MYKRQGIKTAPDADYENLRIVRIKNTLRLDEMEISEALVREAQAMEHISGDWSGSPDVYKRQESADIIRRYDFNRLKERRRANYRYLLEHMPDHPQITVVFPRLPEGTVPSHFTVYAANRDMVQNYLAEQGIKSTTYWPQGAMVDTKGFADADYIYNHVLSKMCIRDRDMARYMPTSEHSPSKFALRSIMISSGEP